MGLAGSGSGSQAAEKGQEPLANARGSSARRCACVHLQGHDSEGAVVRPALSPSGPAQDTCKMARHRLPGHCL